MSMDANRRDYDGPPLDIEDVAPNPMAFFASWYQQARAAIGVDVDAMTIATVDASGQPHARLVLQRGYDQAGVRFFTNCASHKGQDLAHNPRLAAVFYWAALDRQVRIEGVCERLPNETVAEYYHSRPQSSQIAAAAAQQSSVLTNRQQLEQAVADLTERYGDDQVPLPDTWGGYLIKPHQIEFWQGRPSRMHDRIRCRLIAETWQFDRLAP